MRRQNKISGKKIILERNNLPPGIYFIQIIQNETVLGVKKIIISD